MSISEPFIRRPVATTLVMIALFIFGLLAFQRLPVSQLPSVDFPTVLVSANLPGASAETMASSVATPLEREFSTIDGLDSMTSSNSQGFSNITLQFSLDRDLDSAAQDVQAAIARASRLLPRDMPTPPSYRKVNPADQPIVYLTLSSTTLPLYVVNEHADTRISQTLSTIRGVAQVQVYGAQKFAVRVQVDPDALASRGLGLDDVAAAIRASNVNLPTGTLYGPNRAFTLEATGQLKTAEAYRDLIVTYKSGAPVRLGEVAKVIDAVENDKTAAWRVDRRALVLAVQKQPGANTVAVSDAIKDLIPRFRQELPAAVDLDILFDRAESVRHSVRDVELTLVLTFALVVLVIFLFLRKLTATFIPSLAMPLAVFGAFAFMYPLGYTLDNLSLMALTLSVGFVVDDAIVVLENIVRHLEQGKTPLQAALDGSREIGFTIVSMTVSLVAVFVPFLFMGGILGRLFREFAVTIAIAILISGFVSLTLTPMLSARLLRPEKLEPQGRFYATTERIFEWFRGLYGRALSHVLRWRKLTLAFSAAILAVTVLLFQRMPKGFLPTEDLDQLFIMTEAVEGISFDAVKERQQQVAAVVKQHPDVQAFMSSVGARGAVGGANNGIMFARLRPRSERDKSAQQIAAELMPRVNQVPGMRAFVQVPPTIRIGGMLSKSEYQLTIQGAETAELYRHAPLFADELAKSKVVKDVTTDLLLKNPELELIIDRDRAASLGVSVEKIEDALFSGYGSRQVSTIYATNNTYQVILELDPAGQREPSAIDRLHVRSSAGELVPLRSLVEVRPAVGPLSVNHAGQLPAVTVSFNVAPGYGLSQAVELANETARRMLPAGMSLSFAGAAQAFESSLTGLGLLLIVSIFVIYIVLGVLYESFIHPITILSALPFAGFGALVTLMIFGVELNVYAFVGVILLVGLVKKNGIMMVDFAVEARNQGMSAIDAIHTASMTRFRPIMMTTMAALFGTLPIALGLGAGAESRQPLGLAVVGGLLFSQFLTLFVTPVFYVVFEHIGEALARRRSRKLERRATAVSA